MTAVLSPESVTMALQGFGTVEQVQPNRFRVTTVPDRLRETVVGVQETLACDRLVTISCADTRLALELHYHFTGQHRTIVTVTTALPRENPAIPTMSDILLPAGIYERQIHDLFGIVFSGHPDLAKILLNEDWPAGEYPLKKDWKPGEKTSRGGTPPEGQ
jgi:NADH-quinone oxidoreductase subunit C